MTAEDEAPSLDASDEATIAAASDEQALEPPIYFPVSVPKMIVMSIASGGFYQLYWSYRNWKYIRQADDSTISPFWRAVFALFFHYSLVKRVKADTSARTVVLYHPALLTVLYLSLLLAWQLPGFWRYVSYLDFLALLPVVQAVNSANEGRAFPWSMNTRFTGWNLALIALAIAGLAIEVLRWVRPELWPS
jgi:hypothetical protein